jgi:hypothetical protein
MVQNLTRQYPLVTPIARTFMTYRPGQPTHKIIPAVILV